MDIFEVLNSIPKWLTNIISGIVGVGAKIAYDASERRRTERKSALEKEKLSFDDAISQLEQLKALLEESYSIFVSQAYQRNRLASLLKERLGDEVPLERGYDEAFHQVYDRMKREERELFDIIRGLTMYSVYRVNDRLLQWTDNNTSLQPFPLSLQMNQRYNSQIIQLKTHLSSWLAKYEAVFKNDERRSLVYLGDEKYHGEKFPSGLSGIVT